MKKLLITFVISLFTITVLTSCGGVADEPVAEEAREDTSTEGSEDTSIEDSEETVTSDEAVSPFGGEITTVECNETYEGQTVYFHQQAGREGPLAAILGDSFALATSDAINEINAAGGICGAMIEIIFRETQYNVEQEIVAYEEARSFDPKPAFILTYGSGATIALKDRVIEDEIVNFVSGLNAKAIYDPANGYTVSFFPIYSDQFAGFVQWASENWAEVKPEGAGDDIVVGVIGWANAFGAGATTPEAIAYAESLGVTVLPLEEQAISPDADVTGQIQNLLLSGANVIYSQNLSFGTAQVIGTIHALGAWDQVIVGGVNWATNNDVFALLGENANLAEGYYGVYPHLAWNDTDAPGVQQALAAFEAGGHDLADQNNTYITTYATMYIIANIYRHAANMVGLENVDGPALLTAMEGLGDIGALGILSLNLQDGNRSGHHAQIRQAKFLDGRIQFETVQDFFVLPDAKPAVSE